MNKVLYGLITFSVLSSPSAFAQSEYEQDVIKTAKADIVITFLGHGSLMLEYEGKIIYIDPYSLVADYSKLPKADLIIITHHHKDHLDKKALSFIQEKNTELILTSICAQSLNSGQVLKNGDKISFKGIDIEAVPAYNINQKRDNGEPFHIKGEGNGYILTFGDKRIYIAGDSEYIPEMKNIKEIYCAFLPMNLPFTMTPEMAADAARILKPAILYPYHFGETDTSKLVNLLEKDKSIEVRIRKMK